MLAENEMSLTLVYAACPLARSRSSRSVSAPAIGGADLFVRLFVLFVV